jgi:hypothetical protein
MLTVVPFEEVGEAKSDRTGPNVFQPHSESAPRRNSSARQSQTHIERSGYHLDVFEVAAEVVAA